MERTTVRIDHLDEACWLRAHRVEPIGRQIEDDKLAWTFADTTDVRRLLTLFRERGAAVDLIRAFAFAPDHELKVLSVMRSRRDHGGRR